MNSKFKPIRSVKGPWIKQMKIRNTRQWKMLHAKEREFHKRENPIYANRMGCEMWGVWNLKYLDGGRKRR